MAKKYDESDGIWRTVGGRRIFIRNDQTLADAMKESGKFKREVAQRELFELEKQHKHKGHPEYEKKPKELKDNEYTKEQKKEKMTILNEEIEDSKRMLKEMERRLNKPNLTDEQIDEIEDKAARYEAKLHDLEQEKRDFEKGQEERDKKTKFPTTEEAVANLNKAKEEQAKQQKAWDEQIEKAKRDAYESKAYGSDVRKMDEEMKKLFGEDFKYAEEIAELNEDEVTSYSQWKEDYGTNIAELEKDLKLSERYLDKDSEGYREAKKSLENGRKYLEDLKKADKTIKSDQAKYRNEFEEYKRKHPNTDLSLADYIKIKHAGVGAYK